MDLEDVGIALYLGRKTSKCQGGNKSGCLNTLLAVKSSCHAVAVSDQHTLGWVLCASAPSQGPLQVLAEKWEVGGKKDDHLSARHPRVVPAEWGGSAL